MNKNGLVMRDMEVIIGVKKISLYYVFELFAAFFHLANELFTWQGGTFRPFMENSTKIITLSPFLRKYAVSESFGQSQIFKSF